jgi:predicted nucleotidyltransferase component of viral defense system
MSKLKKKKGIPMAFDATKHKDILVKVLHDIYTDSFLAPTLGFKRGTAAMLFYELPRFSVDLDFDLLISEKADEVFTRMNELLEQYGTVKEAKNMANGLFFILSYKDKPFGS